MIPREKMAQAVRNLNRLSPKNGSLALRRYSYWAGVWSKQSIRQSARIGQTISKTFRDFR